MQDGCQKIVDCFCYKTDGYTRPSLEGGESVGQNTPDQAFQWGLETP
jgi:hypothetical protein